MAMAFSPWPVFPAPLPMAIELVAPPKYAVLLPILTILVLKLIFVLTTSNELLVVTKEPVFRVPVRIVPLLTKFTIKEETDVLAKSAIPELI